MQDEAKNQDNAPSDLKVPRSNDKDGYGSSKLHPSSYLQNSESKIKILESQSNKTLKVSWNPKNHMLAFGGDNQYSSLWN